MTKGNEPSAPSASRPDVPVGYGLHAAAGPEDVIPWSWAEERLASARNYWIVTARPDGRPHAMPVWGVWLDGRLHFGTDRGSRKGRNLAANPAIVVHLESGDEVVIVEGVVEEVMDPAWLTTLDEAYHAKYKVHLVGIPGDVVIYATRSRKAFGWLESDFLKATRWNFGHGDRLAKGGE